MSPVYTAYRTGHILKRVASVYLPRADLS